MTTIRPFWEPEVETMNRADLAWLQFSRLQPLVQRCAASPFYRRLWRTSGFRPEQLDSLDDLRRIPFTCKEDLLEAQVREPPLGDLPCCPPEAWREIYPVSTADGGMLYSAYSDADLERNSEIGARILWGCGVRPGDLVHNSFGYGLFGGGLAVHRSTKTVGAGTIPIGTDSVQRQVELLFNLKPTAIVAIPSRAMYLMDRIRERGLHPRDAGLRLGIFGGEPGVAAGRDRLEQAFGLKAYDLYGITEVGPLLAAECTEQNGLHWAEDHVLVEVVDPNTRVLCRPGEMGVLVLTDLTREHMPLIRYWTGDLAVMNDEPCPCGRTHVRTVGGIRGRADAMVIFQGAKFYPAKVEQVLYAYGDLGPEYRIVLERNLGNCGDSCTVLVEAAPGSAINIRGLEDRLRRQLQDGVHPDINVQIVRYGSLERVLNTARRVEDRR